MHIKCYVHTAGTYKTVHTSQSFMACQSLPEDDTKRESDLSYFHCSP